MDYQTIQKQKEKRFSDETKMIDMKILEDITKEGKNTIKPKRT